MGSFFVIVFPVLVLTFSFSLSPVSFTFLLFLVRALSLGILFAASLLPFIVVPNQRPDQILSRLQCICQILLICRSNLKRHLTAATFHQTKFGFRFRFDMFLIP